MSSEETGDGGGKAMRWELKLNVSQSPSASLFLIPPLVHYSFDFIHCIFSYLVSVKIQMPSGRPSSNLSSVNGIYIICKGTLPG